MTWPSGLNIQILWTTKFHYKIQQVSFPESQSQGEKGAAGLKPTGEDFRSFKDPILFENTVQLQQPGVNPAEDQQ